MSQGSLKKEREGEGETERDVYFRIQESSVCVWGGGHLVENRESQFQKGGGRKHPLKFQVN